MKRPLIGVLVFALSGAAFVVRADTATDTLSSTDILGATSPFATVVLDQIGTGANGAGEVQVTVTLDSGATQFANGVGTSFAFNTTTGAVMTVTDLPTGVNWTSVSSSPGGGAGTYNNALVCSSSCSGPTTSSLTFDVTGSGLTASDFTVNGSNSIFAADVVTTKGTGFVYGGTLTAAPEPHSYLALLTLGMLGLVVVRKWRVQPR